MTLTSSQVDAYHRNGFLAVDDVLNADELQAFRDAAATSAVRDEQRRRGHDEVSLHVLALTRKHPLFLELSRDSRILDCVRPLIGDDIQLQHSKIATKPPARGKGERPMHQDYAYFPHTNFNLVAVMVMLDDATPENGCMQAVPGSHRLGPLPHREDGHWAPCQRTDLWDDPSKLVDLTPRAGGISLHHCLTVHGSIANQSDRPRRGLVFQYRADDAYQLAGNVWEDTGILVSGQRHGRVRCDAGMVSIDLDPPYGDAWHQTCHGDD